jgi:hypothetical protein
MRRALVIALIAVLGAGVVWLLGRSDEDAVVSAAPPSGDPPRPNAVRTCRTHIEGRLPPFNPRTDLQVGPVRFFGFRAMSRRATRGKPGDWYEIRDRQYHILKTVTEVRAGADVTVVIAPRSRASAGLLFDRNVKYGRWGIPYGERERAVRFRACAADHPASSPRFIRRRTIGPWTQFNGGWMFTRAQCLTLDVYVHGREPRRYVEPFGRARRDCR